MTNCKKTLFGFTLIELLVVILIIAILAAVALPQYQKAVRRVRFAKIEANMRMLAEAAAECKLRKGDACNSTELDITVPECEPIAGTEWLAEMCYIDLSRNSISLGGKYGATLAEEWYDNPPEGLSTYTIYAWGADRLPEFGFTKDTGVRSHPDDPGATHYYSR